MPYVVVPLGNEATSLEPTIHVSVPLKVVKPMGISLTAFQPLQ